MKQTPETRDILHSFVESRRRRARLRAWLGFGLPGLLVAGGITEVLLWKSTLTFQYSITGAAVLILLGLGFLYSFFLCVVGWTIADWGIASGATRPSWAQGILVFTSSFLFPSFLGFVALKNDLSPAVCLVIGGVLWAHLFAPLTGYLGRFLARARKRPEPNDSV